MRKDKLSKQNVILYFLGIIPVVWLGLLIAPCLEDGLIGLVQQFGTIMQNPFRIELCEDSVKAVLVLLLAYGIAIGVYLSSEHNYRRREEHGSAKWGTAGSVNKKYANKDKTENKILTQNVAIGLDGRKHRRNLNVLVCGGSGAGKTRFFAKPNIMNANTSFVVLDPKGELLRDTGHLLKEHGYDIKVLDLINMEKSHCYNPFVYLQSDDDIVCEDKSMSRTENVELTVLCLIEDGDKILLQNRVKNDWRGYALPGGHVEPGESFVDAVIREMKEETGLKILDPRLVGVKQFPLENGRYVVLLFKATQWSGDLISSEEGQMEWIKYSDLSMVKTVDFDDLLKVMNTPELTEFQYLVSGDEWTVSIR